MKQEESMLAAITCHFNPIEYDNIVRNYWMFREDLQGADLFTIELSFTDKFEIEDAIQIQARPDQVMWQKERLLNMLIQKLPPEYDKVAWLDGDVLFQNPNWAELTEKKLDEFPLVQLFEFAYDTDSNLDLVKKTPGIIRGGLNPTEAKPGYAWAARREVLEKVPLLDTHIMGGADTMMFYAAMGMFNTFMLTRTNIEWRRSYLRWAAKFYQMIRGKMGYVEGDITHLYHGTYADRQYVERWMILSRNRYNPEEDIQCDKDTVWEWASDKPDLHKEVAQYFEERKEDEIWIAKKSGQV
jgi:hypothetical protein